MPAILLCSLYLIAFLAAVGTSQGRGGRFVLLFVGYVLFGSLIYWIVLLSAQALAR